MGLSIKKNNKNKYQIKSTISDELYHEKNWISENDAKKVLIEKEYRGLQQ